MGQPVHSASLWLLLIELTQKRLNLSGHFRMLSDLQQADQSQAAASDLLTHHRFQSGPSQRYRRMAVAAPTRCLTFPNSQLGQVTLFRLASQKLAVFGQQVLKQAERPGRAPVEVGGDLIESSQDFRLVTDWRGKGVAAFSTTGSLHSVRTACQSVFTCKPWAPSPSRISPSTWGSSRLSSSWTEAP